MLTEKDILLAQQLDFPVTLFEDIRRFSPKQGEFEQMTMTEMDFDPETEEDRSFELPLAGFTFGCNPDLADEIIDELHDKWYEKGFYVFLAEMDEDETLDQVGVLKTDDMFEVVRVRQTMSGADDGITTEEIIAKLQEWDSRYPFIVTGADLSWVEVAFLEVPTDTLAFAKEVQAICPDIITIVGSVEELANEIETTHTLFMWWE
jgi:hypothetical protein